MWDILRHGCYACVAMESLHSRDSFDYFAGNLIPLS